MDAFLALRDAAPRAMPADEAVALAVAQERIRGLEELVALEQEWRTMAEEQLALVQALPARFCCICWVALGIVVLPIDGSVPFRRAPMPPGKGSEFVCLPLEGIPAWHGASYDPHSFPDFGGACAKVFSRAPP